MPKKHNINELIRSRGIAMQLEGRRIVFMTRRLGGGGAERMTAILASNFARRGLDITVFCIEENDGAYAVDSAVKIASLRPSANRLLGRAQRLLGVWLFTRRFHPDVVIALGGGIFYIEVLNRFLDCELVLSERNWPPNCYDERQFVQIENLYRTATKVVFQTHEAQACFSEEVQKNSTIIPNAVMPGLPGRHKPVRNRIVAVGRLEAQKNYSLLLEAFARFAHRVNEKYSLDIYGVGGMEGYLRARAVDLGIDDQVVFWGFSANVHEQIADARMFVTSSDFEGIQNSLMEAMAMGIPCIATDCLGGGARLVTADGTRGLLVPCGDAEALAEAMRSIATDEALAQRLSVEGSAVKEIYSEEAVCEMWLQHIQGE